MLGIELTDADVGNVPLLRTDPYGNFIPHGVTGFAQLIVGLGEDGIPNTADDDRHLGRRRRQWAPGVTSRRRCALRQRFPRRHRACGCAGRRRVACSRPTVRRCGRLHRRRQLARPQTAYDDELLDAHYITGDGRGNENIGLTAIHHVFHSEHNGLVEQTKQVVLESGDLDFLNEWLLVDVDSLADHRGRDRALVWDGERLFQAGRFTNEMEYQHLVFEEFGRKMQPDIDAFVFEPSVDINPAIFAEFAHVVYRFGHSMLNEDIDRHR